MLLFLPSDNLQRDREPVQQRDREVEAEEGDGDRVTEKHETGKEKVKKNVVFFSISHSVSLC